MYLTTRLLSGRMRAKAGHMDLQEHLDAQLCRHRHKGGKEPCLHVVVGLLQRCPEQLHRPLAGGMQALRKPLRKAADLCGLQACHLEGPKEPDHHAALHSACAHACKKAFTDEAALLLQMPLHARLCTIEIGCFTCC